jgi:hypothetical protein
VSAAADDRFAQFDIVGLTIASATKRSWARVVAGRRGPALSLRSERVVGGTDAPALEKLRSPAKSVALLRPACGGGSFRLRLRPLERRPGSGSATSRWRLMRTPRRIAGR